MQWISLVMKCVSTISYSLLINGESQSIFKPTRGIHQDDPLSPYLFIICVETLSSLLFHAKRIGSISNVPIGSGLVSISHLFFADDYLLIIIRHPLDVKQNLTHIASVKAQGSFEKYLGLPVVIGRNKTKSFQSLLDKTWNCISN